MGSRSDDENDYWDPSSPSSTITHAIDLPLNTQVLKISTPIVPTTGPVRPANTVPEIFKDNIVFAVACADCSVRLVSLPKTSLSENKKSGGGIKSSGSWYGEEIVVIGGSTGHNTIPNSISLTWTARGGSPACDPEEGDESMDVDEAIPGATLPKSSFQSGHSSAQNPVNFDFIIASHGIQGTGVVYFFRIPYSPGSTPNRSFPEPAQVEKTLYLPDSASRIAFSPNAFPNKRHSQLLISDSKGSIRVYDFLAGSTGSRRRTSSNQSVGAWIASFSTSFKITSRSDLACPHTAVRKRVLDAQWASGGRSIFALLADGEWGVWDVENSASGNKKGISNAAVFAISGFVGSTNAHPVLSGSSGPKTGSMLAPMTPNTRRAKQDTFIHGPTTVTPPSSGNNTRGGLSIASQESASSGIPEDSVVIWFGNDVYRIPNLAQYWARSVSGSDGGLYGRGLSRVEGIHLRGENITDIDQFDTFASVAKMGVPRDLLVAAEQRLLTLGRSPSNPREGGSSTLKLFGDFNDQDSGEDDVVDQALLARRELDLNGMDRLLDNMVSQPSRRVGFAA